MVAPGRFAAGRLLLVLLAAGCGDVDAGSAPFAGALRYQGSGYALSLLEPPWIPVTVAGQAYFLVPPSDAAIPTDVTQALDAALYSLNVAPSDDAPMVAMNALWAGLPKESVEGPSAVTTASGASGLEVSWKESDTVFHRDAFLAGAGTRTFRLHFTGKHALDGDAMLTQMVLSFEPK